MKTIKTLIILTTLTLVFAVFSAVPTNAASKGKLLKEYRYNNYYKRNGKWKSGLDNKVKYIRKSIKYNKKGDPVKIKEKAVYTSGKTKSYGTESFKYKYKKGKTVKRTFGNTVVNYKKGVPTREVWKDEEGYNHSIDYKYNSRYATYVKTYNEPTDSDDGDTTSTITFKLNTKKGLPVKITGREGTSVLTTGILDYTITFYDKGAKRGLVKSAVRSYTVDYHLGEDTWVYKDSYTFKYTVKKGLVTKAVQNGVLTTTTNGVLNDKNEEKNVFKFKYNKKKTNKKRYCSMINDIVANELAKDAYGRLLVYNYWY